MQHITTRRGARSAVTIVAARLVAATVRVRGGGTIRERRRDEDRATHGVSPRL